MGKMFLRTRNPLERADIAEQLVRWGRHQQDVGDALDEADKRFNAKAE